MPSRPSPKSLHTYVFGSFILLALIVASAFVIATRVAEDENTVVFMVLFFVVVLALLGWIFGSVLTRGITDITHDVLRMRDTIDLDHPARCDIDRYRFLEVRNLCSAINDVGGAVAREKRRQAETREKMEGELSDARELLHNFMFYVAHKMRTPLNGIRWATEILKNEEGGRLSSEQRESLDELEHSAVAVLNLAHDLQDVFTIELKGEVKLRRASAHLDEIVNDVAGQWAVSARQKQIDLRVKHPADGLPLVFVDTVRVRQAIDDLVDNAVRYTPPRGKVLIETRVLGDRDSAEAHKRLHAPPQVAGSVMVCVQDSGIGIPKEDQPHVFQKFFRARNAKDQWVDGTGIGLTLAKMVVDAHQGKIWFMSEERKGTTFCFTIPMDGAARRPVRARRKGR
jgi:signal transduction histidine kinase